MPVSACTRETQAATTWRADKRAGAPLAQDSADVRPRGRRAAPGATGGCRRAHPTRTISDPKAPNAAGLTDDSRSSRSGQKEGTGPPLSLETPSGLSGTERARRPKISRNHPTDQRPHRRAGRTPARARSGARRPSPRGRRRTRAVCRVGPKRVTVGVSFRRVSGKSSNTCKLNGTKCVRKYFELEKME